jgi:hypothetical protein
MARRSFTTLEMAEYILEQAAAGERDPNPEKVCIREAECSYLAHAKAAKVALGGSCRCVLYRGALRRAVSNAVPLSYLDALPPIRRRLRCQCVGSTIPDSLYVGLATMPNKPALLS